jgi:hypothetical protein
MTQVNSGDTSSPTQDTSDGVRSALIAGMAVVGVLVFGGGIWA